MKSSKRNVARVQCTITCGGKDQKISTFICRVVIMSKAHPTTRYRLSSRVRISHPRVVRAREGTFRGSTWWRKASLRWQVLSCRTMLTSKASHGLVHPVSKVIARLCDDQLAKKGDWRHWYRVCSNPRAQREAGYDATCRPD